MTQTRAQSAVEAFTNVAIGYGVAVAANSVVLPACGVQVSLGQSMEIAVVFCGISALRSYIVRRWFNGR